MESARERIDLLETEEEGDFTGFHIRRREQMPRSLLAHKVELLLITRAFFREAALQGARADVKLFGDGFDARTLAVHAATENRADLFGE